MVLEIKVPHGHDLATLLALWPKMLSYVLSFVYIGIYWNNHHHMLQLCGKVDGATLWANLHLLFWLSLMPFSTGWMGENHFERLPTVIYGLNLLACAIAYYLLQQVLIARQGSEGALARAVGRDVKGKLSPLIYIVGILGGWYFSPWIGIALFALVAAIWIVPDRRIEKTIGH